jgi:CxxC motif-containing protein (DUF1111 family)
MSRILLAVLLLWAVGCTDDRSVTAPDQPEDRPAGEDATGIEPDFNLRGLKEAHTALSGGATTVFDESAEAFSLPIPTLQGEGLERHEEGDEEFEIEFVPVPASENGGLGPVFDNVSCEACHVGDGRGRPPFGAEPFSSLFRASVAGPGPHDGPAPVPGFGGQLQLRSVPGFSPDVYAAVTYAESVGTFSDGTQFSLRVPTYTLTGGYSPLPAGVLVSPRVAPSVFGLGLLEAIPEEDMRALADPDDRDRNQVSGKPNYVYDEIQSRSVLGRFGWKANTPNLVQQAAGAYNGDMGVTSTMFPAESCEGHYPGCEAHPAEVSEETVGNVAFYTQTLGVPARRLLDDKTTDKGEKLFYKSGCVSCHVSTLHTGVHPNVPEVSLQTIHPYTDLLLHDMGPGLADGRPDFQASGSEWRTAPLWGIGLVETVNGHTNFLHDGRARTLLEAVLWHGGEASGARDRVLRMSVRERDALIAFLQSL